MTTTREAFIAEAEKIGLRAEKFDDTSGDREFRGVNVWADPDDRAPHTTVWWPTEKGTEQDFVWGPSFQYGAWPDVDAETLVAKVSATLPGPAETGESPAKG